MIIQGKYNTATVYTEKIEDIAIRQIQEMCDSTIFAGTKLRIMPDVHAGKSCTIGTTMEIKDTVVPNMVGVDIGCGMFVSELSEKETEINFIAIDEYIKNHIPAGMNHREIPHEYATSIDLNDLRCYREINEDLARKSIGTLGGGNHFIEIDKDNEGKLYLVVHSGSRHLGHEVASFYQAEACRQISRDDQFQIRELIRTLKEQGRQSEIQSAIIDAKAHSTDVSPEMAYLSGNSFNDYIHDMKIIQDYAVISRKAMVDDIVHEFNLHVADSFTTIHNYIDAEKMILRKGAVSAQKGEKLLIPINMRDGALICVGKGNEEWNYSAPHGAGRILSRGKARETLSMEDYELQMKGIYTTSVNRNTIDESPMAYKSLDDIVDNITPTVEIIKRIVPVYNFKAGDDVRESFS